MIGISYAIGLPLIVAEGTLKSGIGKLSANVMPVAVEDQIFCRVTKYVMVSPENIISLPVMVLLVTRSAIGETIATAEVNTVVNAVSSAPSIVIVSAGNVQLLVIILPVNIMVSDTQESILKIGS